MRHINQGQDEGGGKTMHELKATKACGAFAMKTTM